MKKLKKMALPLLLVFVLSLLAAAPVSAASKTVAKIGTKKYSSLNTALKKVSNGQTIKLYANVTTSGNIVINRKKNFCLDLNGKTISVKNSSKEIRIANGTVAIKNGTVKAPKIKIEKGAKVTVKSGSYNTDFDIFGKAVFENGRFDSMIKVEPSAKVTIKNGKYTNTDEVFNYLINPCGGTTTISGGTFTGTQPNTPVIGSRSMTNKATLNIKGGKFTSKGLLIDASCKITATISAGTFRSDDSCVGAQEYGKVIIKGGKFTSAKASATIMVPTTLSISGGTFKNLSQNGLAVSASTATISGGTFVSKGTGVIESDTKLTLKGGTFKFSGKGAGHTIAVYGSLNMTGGKVYDVNNWSSMRVYGGGKANITGGTFYVSSSPVMAMGSSVKIGKSVVVKGLPKGDPLIQK